MYTTYAFAEVYVKIFTIKIPLLIPLGVYLRFILNFLGIYLVFISALFETCALFTENSLEYTLKHPEALLFDVYKLVLPNSI